MNQEEVVRLAEAALAEPSHHTVLLDYACRASVREPMIATAYLAAVREVERLREEARTRMLPDEERTKLTGDALHAEGEMAGLQHAFNAAVALGQKMEELADEAFAHLDADRDSKAIRLLAALAGKKRGYRPDLDAARDALVEACVRKVSG